jgi:hypothetical protein
MCRFVHKPPILTKGSDILKEIKKFSYFSVKDSIENLPKDKQELCNNILNELIFMENTMNDLKKEIQDKGVVVDMCQGKYSIQRTNPALNQYNTTIKNYTSCIKQLNELLPSVSPEDDEFDNDEL